MRLIDLDELEMRYPNFSVLPRECLERCAFNGTRKHAKWEFFAADEWGKVFYCSNCRATASCDLDEESPLTADYRYCYRCGCVMEVVKDE